MKLSWMAGLIASALVAPAFAQQVPALQGGEVLPPIPMLSPDSVKLDQKDAAALKLANEWRAHPDKPRKGDDGSVKYLFGATMPTLICSPVRVCVIELQPGEIVSEAVQVGDKARWKVSPTMQGSGESTTTLLVVKPTDSGLETNMAIPTDRRLYQIRLVSTQKQWIPRLSFDYPDDIERAWANYREKSAKQVYNNTMPTGQNLANLDFGFRLGGDSPSWKPVRVYSDGAKTYIQFPSANFGGEAPALVLVGDDGGVFRKASERLVNARPIGDRYVVDKVIQKAALIVGVGSKQTRVTITREGK